MEYRRLGRSGIRVSPLCLGTMMFGDRTDAAEAERIVSAARESGINFIDTADVYAKGESERITGRLIAADRPRWILATKINNPMGDDPNDRGASRRWLVRGCEMSLQRLGTDYIDIYYLHRDDMETPLEETIAALADLVRAGKIRYVGLSNFRAWRIAAFVAQCRVMNLPLPVVCQPYYNAMNRMPEVEVLPACAHFGLGVVPYSPLARGVLTGKYQPDAAPPVDSRAGRSDTRMMQTEFRRESLEIAQKIRTHAEARGMSAGQFAVRWVLNNRLATSVLAGPRTLAQWQEYAAALDKSFSAEDETLVDAMVPAGHPSTPGFTDPVYPVTGRVTA